MTEQRCEMEDGWDLMACYTEAKTIWIWKGKEKVKP